MEGWIEMNAKEFMAALFEREEYYSVVHGANGGPDAYVFTLHSGEKPEIFQCIYDSAEEMFQEFEDDPQNTCDSEWREGYMVEVLVRDDGSIGYTCGTSRQDIANQPEWFVDTAGDDLIDGYLGGLYQTIREECPDEFKAG